MFCGGDCVVCSAPIAGMEQAMGASAEGKSKMSPRIMARGILDYSMLPVRDQRSENSIADLEEKTRLKKRGV
jgi:hypothetical protein